MIFTHQDRIGIWPYQHYCERFEDKKLPEKSSSAVGRKLTTLHSTLLHMHEWLFSLALFQHSWRPGKLAEWHENLEAVVIFHGWRLNPASQVYIHPTNNTSLTARISAHCYRARLDAPHFGNNYRLVRFSLIFGLVHQLLSRWTALRRNNRGRKKLEWRFWRKKYFFSQLSWQETRKEKNEVEVEKQETTSFNHFLDICHQKFSHGYHVFTLNWSSCKILNT